MKYQWLKKQDCTTLGKELGCIVKSIRRGIFDENDFLQEGIEIELENETPEILEKLDMKLQGLKREGGKDVADVISTLQGKVTELEKAKPTPVK